MVIIDSSPPHPEAALNEQMTALVDTGAESRCFALKFPHRQYYLPGEPTIPLVALVALRANANGVEIELGILLHTPALVEHLQPVPAQLQAMKAFAENSGAPWLKLNAPLQLSPVNVPKPWGQEIWYTGIEVRGQSSVIAKGRKTPLPWVLELLPERLGTEYGHRPVLLKVLDPHADSDYGDLYFEVHRRKREVYVVTHIDSQAWPSGVGGIRYGFNPQKRARYGSDADFKREYLAAVQAYEVVRREVDQELDKKRQSAGVDLNTPLSPATLARWQTELEPELNARERFLREAMESFTAIRPLGLGDTVSVPPMTPHALLHGVRVVEFQTPDYERRILSFGQKVLNQSQWDTATAIDELDLNVPPQHPPREWVPMVGVHVEELVDFPDFAVIRVTLSEGHSVSLGRLRRCLPAGAGENSYLLIMGLEGTLSWSGTPGPGVRPGEAQLVPRSCPAGGLVSEQKGVFLLAAPRGTS